MLHKPFKTVDKLLTFKDNICQNFFKAWERFKQDNLDLTYNRINNTDNQEEEEAIIYKPTLEEIANNNVNINASQAKLARQLLNRRGGNVDKANQLSNRDINRATY